MTFFFAFILAMGFAWAIGGEKYFGKWRRGALIAIPMTCLSIFDIAWYWIPLQLGLLYCVYQALSYDPGIESAYKNPDPVAKIIGWSIIIANGALVGLTPMVHFVGDGSWWKVFISVPASAIAFCAAVALSNDPKFEGYRSWLRDTMPTSAYLKFRDSWYVSCLLFGMALGVLCYILR